MQVYPKDNSNQIFGLAADTVLGQRTGYGATIRLCTHQALHSTSNEMNRTGISSLFILIIYLFIFVFRAIKPF